ncbi:hypothetical protein Tco_1305235 [Tanacetum coccineum]
MSGVVVETSDVVVTSDVVMGYVRSGWVTSGVVVTSAVAGSNDVRRVVVRFVTMSYKESKGSGSSEPKHYATCGIAIVEPKNTTIYNRRSGAEKGTYETKSYASFNDKQIGSYGRATVTEKASSGNFHWKNGTSGTKNEYKQTETVRYGDKSGYAEVYNERRVRDVSYVGI